MTVTSRPITDPPDGEHTDQTGRTDWPGFIRLARLRFLLYNLLPVGLAVAGRSRPASTPADRR